ncbi:MAG TPA: hypothetical protein GX507_04240 [Clostridia bacterium]|nr:hypothetical protein [Clostridia bacterium]
MDTSASSKKVERLSVREDVCYPGSAHRAVCGAVGLTKTIDDMLRWDPSRCRLSPGSRIEVIIINALTNRCPQLRALGCS